MIPLLKKILQICAESTGHRIVPRNRDTLTLLKHAEKLPITTVIDVGANVGHTCRHWLNRFPLANVHAIEALERLRPSLELIAAQFPGRMTIWPVAASDHSGELTFRVHEEHPSSSSLLPSTPESHRLLPFTKSSKEIVVRAERLDELFTTEGIPLGKSILLKLDVQGAELAVLRGCEGFLGQVACVLCEINLQALYEGQADFGEIIEHLRAYGLEFSGVAEQFHADDGRAIYLDAIFLRDAPMLSSRA